MRLSPRFRLAALASALAILALVHASTEAQDTRPAEPRGAKPADPPPAAAEVILATDVEEEDVAVMADHLALPMTVKSVKTWLRLQEPVAMSFVDETPLEDVLKYIKSATHRDGEKDIPLYVDPAGLQEAEQTLTSPVTLDVEDVPLAKSLALLLKQLEMTYVIDRDGILVITASESESGPVEVLSHIATLRDRAARLRGALAVLGSVRASGGMGESGNAPRMGAGFR